VGHAVSSTIATQSLEGVFHVSIQTYLRIPPDVQRRHLMRQTGGRLRPKVADYGPKRCEESHEINAGEPDATSLKVAPMLRQAAERFTAERLDVKWCIALSLYISITCRLNRVE
jgi:hypothetical protein